MMKKVIKKGYTLEVTSWENDGDHYSTKAKTVETREEAERLFKICTELFKSCNNGEGGVGNSIDSEENQTLFDYVEDNPELFLELIEKDEDEIVDYFQNLADELMGSSDFYGFRVCESCQLTYSPEDIYLEEVIF